MKKLTIFGISILSVFILCSLSYQPIIADTPIETISIAKKSKASDLDVDEIKELYNKLVAFKSQSNDDCGCEETTEWRFPITCTILFNLAWMFLILYAACYAYNLIILGKIIILPILAILASLYDLLGCYHIWPNYYLMK